MPQMKNQRSQKKTCQRSAASLATRVTARTARAAAERSRACFSILPPTVSRPSVPPSSQYAVTAAEAKASTAAAWAGGFPWENREEVRC
jgi:hypothetical protein